MIINLCKLILLIQMLLSNRTGLSSDALPFLRAAAAAAADADPERDSVLVGIASAFARAGSVDDALRVAIKTGQSDRRESAIGAVWVAQASAGDLQGALRTANLLDIGSSRKTQLITLVAMHRALSGDACGAIHLVESELKEESKCIPALRLVAKAQQDAGDVPGAIRTLMAIPSPVARARAKRLEALSLIKSGDFTGALRTAEETRRMVRRAINEQELLEQSQQPRDHNRGGPPLDPNMFWDGLLEEIALGQAKAGSTTEALKSAESITSVYWKSCTVAKIAAIRARAGDKAAAKAMIARAAELASESGYRGFELTEIAAAQALAGETDVSRGTFLRALRTVGVEANQHLVVLAQAQVGDIEGARQTAEKITDATARMWSMEHIAAARAANGDVRGAIKDATSLPSAGDQARLLLRIAKAQADAGDKPGAVATVRRVVQINAPLDGELLRSLAKALVEFGDVDAAEELLMKTGSPETKARGLLGIAEGMLPENRIANMQ